MKFVDSTPIVVEGWGPIVEAQKAALAALDRLYQDRFDAIVESAQTATAQADAERVLRDLRIEHFAAREPLSKALAQMLMRAQRPSVTIQLEPGEEALFAHLPPAKG